MSQSKLQQRLNPLWGATIEHVEVNLAEFVLRFELKVQENSEISRHKLEFEGVISYFMAPASGSPGRTSTDAWSYAELTAIEYWDKAVITPSFVAQEDVERSDSLKFEVKPNFVLELWNANFFVEAKRVRINGEVFILQP